jgi:O-antigen ligase
LSAEAVAISRPAGLPAAALGRAVLWFAVFLGGFVFREPAPYELFLAVVIPLWLLSNPPLPRALAPLVVLMTAFITGGLAAATQAKDLDTQVIYYCVTGFLALSSCFYAATLGAFPRLFKVVVNAWIAAALFTVALGIAGYFGLTGELFTRFQRAAGGFEDPNVFGPFLVFPFVVLLRRTLTAPLGAAAANGLLALFILAGIFLSFSRGAWGLVAVSGLALWVLLFVMERDLPARMRQLILAAVGAIAIAVLIAAALSIPAISDLFQERAHIVQDYDAGRLGRFQRHLIGFQMMLEHPLGIGALELGSLLAEDEHNIWLKALTTYGWLGFAAFFALVAWTLAGALPLVFRNSPLQPVTQCAYIVFAGHLALAMVIDIDHWRHVYLLIGLLWGAIAADRLAFQARLAQTAARPQ